MTTTSNPPSKAARAQCYSSRDAYFSCLDRHGIISTRQPTVEQLMKSRNNPYHRQMNGLSKDESPPVEVTTPASEKELETRLPAECQPLVVEFKKNCLASWVIPWLRLDIVSFCLPSYSLPAAISPSPGTSPSPDTSPSTRTAISRRHHTLSLSGNAMPSSSICKHKEPSQSRRLSGDNETRLVSTKDSFSFGKHQSALLIL